MNRLPLIALLATGIFGQTAATVTAVQNGASFTSRIAPGSFATIKGTNFTTAPLSSNVVPVPTSLVGVTVSLNGVLCPIYYVNPTQINFLVPWNTQSGPVPLIVTARRDHISDSSTRCGGPGNPHHQECRVRTEP